jgi:hypothetical protein
MESFASSVARPPTVTSIFAVYALKLTELIETLYVAG